MSPHASAPFISPHKRDARPTLVFAFAVGAAALASQFLVGDIPTWPVPLAAAFAALYGGAALLARRPIRFALVTSVPAAVAVTWGAYRAAGHEGWLSAFDGVVTHGRLAICVLVPVLAVAFGAPVRAAFRATIERSHDAQDRVMLIAALWLAFIAMSTLGLRAGGDIDGWFAFGRGGLTWLLPAFALALGAAFAATVFYRDTTRLRWLRAVLGGKVPGLAIVPRFEVDTEHHSDPSMRYLAACRPDGALVASNDSATIFRDGSSTKILAWLPLDSTSAIRHLRRRSALAAVFSLMQVAAALPLAWAVLAHQRPLTGIVAVTLSDAPLAGGAPHACALHRSHDVLCWGSGANGYLGNGHEDDHNHPVAVSGLHDAVQVEGSCALRRSGEVVCWGGEDTARHIPTPVPGLPPVARLLEYACALTIGEEVYCRRPFFDERSPWILSAPAAGALDVVSTAFGVCGRYAQGIRCWTRTRDDEAPRELPLPCLPPPLDALDKTPRSHSLASHLYLLCEVASHGAIRCSTPRMRAPSGKPHCQEPFDLPTLPGARKVLILAHKTCAIDGRGDVRCHAGAGDWSEPILDHVVDLASSHPDRLCAVRDDGTVWCWGGDNAFGEVGDGTRRRRALPTLVRR